MNTRFQNVQPAVRLISMGVVMVLMLPSVLWADLPDGYQKKNSWRATLIASAPAAGLPSPTSKKANPDWPYWQQLMEDFPQQKGLIGAAYDWGKQDKLPLSTPAAGYKPTVMALLDQTRKVQASVLAAGAKPVFASDLKALEETCAKGGDWRNLYYDLHILRRRILFTHPALNFDQILFNQNPPTLYSHNCDQHLGRHSRVGPGLSILKNWKDDAPNVSVILEGKLPPGATRNPDLNYDADKVVFGFCDHSQKGQKRYFLYEAALDGSWVRQLTGTKQDTF